LTFTFYTRYDCIATCFSVERALTVGQRIRDFLLMRYINLHLLTYLLTYLLCTSKMFNHLHFNHQLLPSVKCSSYNLRSRRHNYILPNNNATLISNNFINRMLFADLTADA